MKNLHHFQNKYTLAEYIAGLDKKIHQPGANFTAAYDEISDLLSHIENPLDEMKSYRDDKEIVGPLLMLQAFMVEEDKVTPAAMKEKDKYIVNLWERAAKVGYAEGQNHLGECHLTGSHGVKKDPELAVELFSEAVKSGDLKALWHLGSCYALGLGAVQNMSKAIESWSEAAMGGDMHAKESLFQYKDAVILYMKNKIAFGVYHKLYDICGIEHKAVIDAKINKEKATDLEILIKDPKLRGKFIGKQIKDISEQEILKKVVPMKKKA